jgi:hypothetical protein
MKFRVIIFFALFAALSSSSLSQTKQPPSKAEPSSPQQQLGSEKSPAFVKVLGPEKTEQELDADKEKQQSDRQLVKLTGDLAFYTELLFLATAVLALVTAGLLVFGFIQRGDTKRSIEAAEKSAGIAEKSAGIAERALTELEAPFLAIRIVEPGIRWGEARRITFDHLKFVIANYGRTPAHILELREFVEQVPIGSGIPVLDPSKERGDPMPYGVVAPPSSHTQEFKTVTNIDFFEGSSGSVFADITQRAYFRGFVRYTDLFAAHFVLGFCFVFDVKENRWVLMGGKEHNYCGRDDAFENPEWMHPSSNPSDIRSAINRAVLNTSSKNEG